MINMLTADAKITGTEINYCFVCPKKLWLFSRGINMEQTSQYVEIGREIHENSFEREKKEILIDGIIMLDFIDRELGIHETKKSRAMEKATRYQILYYIYYLKQKGIEDIRGVVHFPKEKRKEMVELKDEDIPHIQQVIDEVIKIKNLPLPPKVEKNSKCGKCSYYELCFC